MKRSYAVNSVNGFGPHKNMLDLLKNAGFEAVDVDLKQATCLRPDWQDYVKSLREELDQKGITCMQVHLPFDSLLNCCTNVNQELEQASRNAVYAAQILGANWCVFHPRTAMSKQYDWDISRKYTKEALMPLVEIAEKIDTGIAVENIPVFPDCPQHRFFGSDPDDLCELVDSANSSHIGICWDTGHANLMSFDQPKVIRQLGSRIKCTHLHSNYKEQDWHLLPIFGIIDWKRIMKAFRDIEYAGDLSLEVIAVNYKAAQNYYHTAFDAVTMLKDLFENE